MCNLRVGFGHALQTKTNYGGRSTCADVVAYAFEELDSSLLGTISGKRNHFEVEPRMNRPEIGNEVR